MQTKSWLLGLFVVVILCLAGGCLRVDARLPEHVSIGEDADIATVGSERDHDAPQDVMELQQQNRRLRHRTKQLQKRVRYLAEENDELREDLDKVKRQRDKYKDRLDD